MANETLEKIKQMLDLREVRRFGKDLLKGRERDDFGKIAEKYDRERVATERLYRQEYKLRVDIATRDLMTKAGAPKPQLRPKMFGHKRPNRHDFERQAQVTVRRDHQQTMDRLDGLELKESKSFLETCSRRKAYVESFKNASERRRTQNRREGQERRQNPIMSD